MSKQGAARQQMDYESLNESKASIMPSMLKVRAEQDQRFKIFHSLGFQGNPNEALDLICVTLRSLEFVSCNRLICLLLWKAERS